MKNHFEPFEIYLNYPIDKNKINGRGLFAFKSGEPNFSAKRFQFSDGPDISPHKDLCSHLIGYAVVEEAKKRDKLGLKPYGGGKVIICDGKLSICWLGYDEAFKLLNDDFEKCRTQKYSPMFES